MLGEKSPRAPSGAESGLRKTLSVEELQTTEGFCPSPEFSCYIQLKLFHRDIGTRKGFAVRTCQDDHIMMLVILLSIL